MSEIEDRAMIVVAALVRKLGGEVRLSHQELFEAESMELIQFEDSMDRGVAHLQIRQAPVTVEGEVVVDGGPRALTGYGQ